MTGSHPDPGDVTQLLIRAGDGDAAATDELLPLVYQELRRLAQARLANERPDHTLQATSLVHEAYLRLVRQDQTDWKGRSHFLALAATTIRRVLVDHARAHNASKRGGGVLKVTLSAAADEALASSDPALLDLDAALAELAREHPEQARLVEMRFFGGMGNAECADVLGVSERTVERRWRFARAWLYLRLTSEPPA